MALNINLNLSEKTYEKFLRLAKQRQQNIVDFLQDYLEDDELRLIIESHTVIDLSESDSDVEQEQAAYIGMHSKLKERHLGEYVAIYQGKLIDYDSDYGSLFERIQSNFPDTFVWITRVENEAEPVRYWRSSRISAAAE